MNTRFPHAYVLNVMSDDHPGIVSAVSTAVTHLGGNIDAASQTVLGGYFTLIMVVSLPQPLEARDLAAKVRGPESAGLQVVARPFSPGDLSKPGGRAERVEFGGLFGSAVVMDVRNTGASADFVRFGGRIPAPIQSLRN